VELVASLPPDLTTLADPTARAGAPALRSSDRDDAAAAAALPFELLLGLLVAPPPTGESLPAAGNSLPAAAVDALADSTAPTGAPAKPVTPSPAATGADLLARLKLAAAPAPGDGAATLAAHADAAGADAPPPFADLAVPEAPALTSAKPALPGPAPAAAPSDAAPLSGQDVVAALQAALPQTAPQNAPPKSPRPGETRAAEQVGQRAAAPTELQAASPTAPAPVADIDTVPRPAHRDAPVEAFVLPDAPAASDAAAPPANSPPALAPAQPHAAGTAQAADASALSGQGTPIDTRADRWHDALASRVQVLVDQHVGEARIKLNPPELGSVDIKISLVDDKTFVQLTAGTSAARDELSQSLPRLRELLSAGGLSLGGASVHGGHAGAGGQEAASGRIGVPAYASSAVAADDEPQVVRFAPRATGRIDLFA
jgi:flagellar hook-length control protein FliK